jgi:nucleoside phosphorylase
MSEPPHPDKGADAKGPEKKRSPVARLIELLRGEPLGLDDVQLAEVLWLAQRLPLPPPAQEPAPEPIPEKTPEATRPQQPGSEPTTSTPPRMAGTPEAEAVLLTGHAESAVATGQRQTDPFRAPTPRALQQPLDLGRALRALRRNVNARGREEADEEATAARIADEGLWLPWMRPVRVRWLWLELVVDASRSMALWRQTVRELRTLLHHHGAFQDVRTWSLVTDDPGGRVRLYRGPASNGTERNRRELLDATGRRLIVMASDCISAGWHSGSVGELLQYWGARAPVAILQVLPERLWGRTALRRSSKAWLHGTAAGIPNVRLVSGPAPGQAEPRELGEVPIPVVTLEKESLKGWGRMVGGVAGAWTSGMLLAKDGDWGTLRSPSVMTAAERVRRFEATASPLARRLVRLFAAAPLSLPVMRLIWQTMLPEARHAHFAEVVLSGLLHQVAPERAVDPEEAPLDFVEGVREVLLESVPSSQTWEVLRASSRFIKKHLGKTLDFPALLANPRLLGEEMDERLRPFAQVAVSVLRQLGGYDELVARLEGAPVQRPAIGNVPSEVPPTQKGPEKDGQATPVESRPAGTWRWSGKWVAVVGPSERYPFGPDENAAHYQRFQWAGTILGQLLAREGHGLISQARSRVHKPSHIISTMDMLVGRTYAQEVRRLGGDPNSVLRQGIRGHPLFLRHSTRDVEELPLEADAVVLLGGALGEKPDIWALYTGTASVSTSSEVDMESFPVPPESETHAWNLGFIKLLLRLRQIPTRIAPYARALLLLIASKEAEPAENNPWEAELPWLLFQETGLPLPVRHDGGGFFKTLLETELAPQATASRHELRTQANRVALQKLQEQLPAMSARLRKDFWQMLSLGELGARVQTSLKPLLSEFSEHEHAGEKAQTLRAVILTTLPVEYQAVRAHLGDLHEEIHPLGTVYEQGHFLAKERTWDVLIAELGPSSDRERLEWERILQAHNPSVVLLVGIAGGIKDVAIGDVVVATQVYNYESGKATSTTETRLTVSQSSALLVQRAQQTARREDWLARIREPLDARPQVFVGPIVSGLQVVTDPHLETFRSLREHYGDALAVDMEGIGGLKAIQADPIVSVLVVRGISDLMGDNKEAGAPEEAAQNAAAFAFEFLAKY